MPQDNPFRACTVTVLPKSLIPTLQLTVCTGRHPLPLLGSPKGQVIPKGRAMHLLRQDSMWQEATPGGAVLLFTAQRLRFSPSLLRRAGPSTEQRANGLERILLFSDVPIRQLA